MTFIELEDAPAEFEEKFSQQNNQTIKCSWCGEVICRDEHELALAMCPACYKKMLDEFLSAQQSKQTPTHPSDR